MDKKLTIGVKFCGNCNPHIATGEVFKNIKDKAGKAQVEFVPWDRPGLDCLLVLGGCPVDCAGRPPGRYPEISVAGESVNLSSCAEDNIAAAVLNLICNFNLKGDKP